MMKENLWNITDSGNNSAVTKTCRTATLRTTHATENGLGLNPGLNGDIPATSRLRNSTTTWSLSCVLREWKFGVQFLS